MNTSFAAALLAALLLAGCDRGNAPVAALTPAEIDRETVCVLDGMGLADYPGPKAQIHYAGAAKPDFFCDPMEMFQMLLRPEQVREVRAAFVQDMAKADWAEPRGHWIDARTALYVVGSKRRGAMGKTFGSFANEADASKFAAEHGGKVLRFAEVTLDMVDLSGGALHDQKM